MHANRITAVIAGLVAIGCGKADQKPAAPVSHDFAITASDYSFQAPDTIVAGMTHVTLSNMGPGLHHVQFVRLDSGKTIADLGTAMKNPGPPPTWATFVGGPNAVAPLKKSEATVELAAGSYAIICLVDAPGHVPHFARGMMRPFTVVAAPAGSAVADVPTSDVQVGLADYAFTLSKPLAAGKQMVEFANNGPQPHELLLVRFAPGKGMADLGKWMDKLDGPPPGEPLGGVSVMMPGTKAYVPFDLTPGDYALLCLVPDAKDGKPHVEHGMSKVFKIG